MIQEKDFLYRVPVKNVLVTTPRQQVRNPEILVDVEGGEFMHGNILDANSTNKLINQSVKDAVDNKLIESGYVTKDLLEAETTRATEQENSLKTLIGAETSARTKGDEDLSSKIKAEQTRAEGKEKEISDKLAIVNGDSNTEGSFRKAIADVVAAAPEDLDTLKEIADKLAGNDDLHTALNQAITEKADASALLNEVTRATGAESGLQAAIDTKQPKGNYLTEHQSLEEYAKKTDIPQVDTSDFVSKTATDAQSLKSGLSVSGNLNVVGNSEAGYGTAIRSGRIEIEGYGETSLLISNRNLNFSNNDAGIALDGDNGEITIFSKDFLSGQNLRISKRGIFIPGGDNNHVLTTGNSTIDITQYALKSELPTVPTKTSQLTNDSNFIAADHISDTYLGFAKDLKIYRENTGNITTISHTGINFETDINDVAINEDGFFVSRDSDDAQLCSFTPSGIKFAGKTDDDIPTANGSFIDISNYATRDFVTAGLSAKQNKITVNTVDITDIETADVTKLRTIVTNLINALSSSGLINATDGVE